MVSGVFLLGVKIQLTTTVHRGADSRPPGVTDVTGVAFVCLTLKRRRVTIFSRDQGFYRPHPKRDQGFCEIGHIQVAGKVAGVVYSQQGEETTDIRSIVRR